MIPIPGHSEQNGNAISIEENNAGVKLDEEKLSEETLRNAINHILDSNYHKMASRYSLAFRSLNPISSILDEVQLLLKKHSR